MFAYVAYGLVVLIWSTTPLAIQWSSIDFHFTAAVALRMAVALALALVLLAMLRQPLRLDSQSLKVYLAAGLGIFPHMPLVYWSAQFIPSGLIALLFGALPFITAGLSFLVFGQNPFNRRRVISLMLAVFGLGMICLDQLHMGENAIYGVAGILVSNVVFAASNLWLKQLGQDMDALSQTAGATLLSLPGLLIFWYLADGSIPVDVGVRSLGGVGYLAIMGTLLGFTLYFYVLKTFSVETVSLTALLTPVFALAVGVWVEGEVLTPRLLLGATLVIAALAFYQGNLYTVMLKHAGMRVRRRWSRGTESLAASQEESA